MSSTNDNDVIEYCGVCRRSSETAGKMIHMPGNITICRDCMQNMMDMASRMDYSQLLNNPGLMNDMMKNMVPELRFPGAGETGEPGGIPKRGEESPSSALPEKENSAGKEGTSGTAGKGTASGQGTKPEGAEQDGDKEDSGQDEEKKAGGKRPTVSFINLGDIFGGMRGGPGQPQVKKKKEPRIKPVFSIDNIPAPHVIKEKLDEYVVGQERAKKALSVAVYNHYKRVKTGHMDDIEIEKSNILMIGPTGCGKTYLVKTLARLLDVPLAIADATSLTEAGYIGDDIESVVSKLLEAADNDVERTERGIIFIDEIDKIAKKRNMTSRDVNGESVQQGMLKLLEGAQIEVPVGSSSKNAMVPMTMVDTRNILFICGGAFPDLPDVIKKRLTKQSGFGYSAELKDRFDSDPDILSRVTTEDLRSFGFIPEFIGRLPVICTLTSMDVPMLVRILKEPRNAILKQYQKLLALDEVDLEFDEDALTAIAEKAKEKDTGARALRAIIEDFMLDIMYEVPKDDNIGRVTITRAYIEGKGGPRIEIRTESPEKAHQVPRLEDHGSAAAEVPHAEGAKTDE